MSKDVYFMYSGATDITGKNLVKELNASGGTKKPARKKLIIGWGAKTKEPISLGSTPVMNHPDKIRLNRNKLKSLKTMKEKKVAVANFVEASKVNAAIQAGTINLPVVGRKKFHQGGKGFWTCLTKTHVKNAIDEGAEYFQNFIDVESEYRLHVFKGNLIYAVKKVKRSNMEQAFKSQQSEKIKSIADKKKKKLDPDTMDFVLGRMAKQNTHANMIIKSNDKGWKFSRIKNENVKKDLLKQAAKAIESLGLDFGAVDCCMDSDGKAWIIEVNTGPGLEGSSLEAYVEAFKKAIDVILNPKPSVTSKVVGAVRNMAANGKPNKVSEESSVKERLRGKVSLFSDLVKNADEDEAKMLENLFAKTFSSSE